MNLDDPRARRSRAQLRTAILELTATKDPAAITMAEIARHAGVHRATVYQHFPDVNALLTEAMEDTVTRVARAAALCPRSMPRHEVPPPLLDLFQHVQRNAALYRRMLGPHGSARFATHLRERVTEALVAAFREGRRPAGFDDVPRDVHAAYLAGALIGVITTWTAQDAVPSASAMAHAFWRLFQG